MMHCINPLLIQVVPRLQPGRCGITDHGIALAQELQAAFDIDTAFAVLGESIPDMLAFAAVRCSPSELPDTCISLSEGRPVFLLVHLSGYGYSPDGNPALLAAALERIKAAGRFPIAVYFHELYAFGPPWKSAFWYSRVQRNSVGRIARLSDLAITNTQYHAKWLERQLAQNSANPLRLLPVFSTVGHACELSPFDRRDPAMAVFGLAGTRQNAYKQLHALGNTLQELGVRKIVDIGPPFAIPSDVNGVAVIRLGELSAADLGRTLASSRYGFVAHPSHCLAKSSIFAAYCAQGVIPVVAESFRGEVDGLTDGLQVVSPATALAAKASGWEACSRAAWTWYMAHRLQAHAEQYANWMRPAA
jgi:hypothetical protein